MVKQKGASLSQEEVNRQRSEARLRNEERKEAESKRMDEVGASRERNMDAVTTKKFIIIGKKSKYQKKEKGSLG